MSWGGESPNSAPVPLMGGAIGYMSYDLARRMETLPGIAVNAEDIPEMMFGIYDWLFVCDHHLQQSWLVCSGMDPKTVEIWPGLVQQFSRVNNADDNSKPFRVLSEITSNISKQDYAQGFTRIKQYLREGDCYQVNFAQRFCAQCEGSSWDAYDLLRKINAAPFSAYLNFPGVQLLSSSPERFLKVSNRQVETKPIKGTRPRDSNLDRDRLQKEALSRSKKDRAENLMIVDLLRNDLGKTCKIGSVNVPKLFDIESFETVHHMVSTVCGELDTGKDAIHLLAGCFPGGSITGAPKIRAMEVIEELEPHRRGAYCGSIAYVGFNGAMDSNILIRTLIRSKDQIRFWAGRGYCCRLQIGGRISRKL